jgi:hypothetical protein
MINRRKFIKAGTCAICASAASAIAEPDYHGCTLSGTEIAQRIEPQVTPRIYGLAEVPVSRGDLHGSGDPTFDRALSVTLLKLSETFLVLPGFAFSERIRLNAFASTNPALGRDDGSVVFGNPLYREIMTRREHPEVGIVAVCAHEFGHIAQFKRGINRILISEKRVKRLELHADFLAGYFAGRRKLELPEFPAAIFATTQYSFGDDNYGSVNHHGTSTERGEAVVAGFNSAYRARESFTTALETGIRYVQQVPL